MKDTPLTAEFKAIGVPIVDSVKGIKEVLAGWDAIGKARAEEVLTKAKIIVYVVVPDWVNPYAKEGQNTKVVIFSTHPLFQVGERFDRGFEMVARKECYQLVKCVLRKDTKEES